MRDDMKRHGGLQVGFRLIAYRGWVNGNGKASPRLMRPILHKSIQRVHRWVGLTIGPVIVMMALTGAVNLFRSPLEPIIDAGLLTVESCAERVPLDRLAANARAVHPAAALDFIKITAGAEGSARMPATRVRFTDRDSVYLNPCTGAVLGQRARFGGVMGAAEQLHTMRFGENGELPGVTAICAILFAVFLIGGGLMMWWPARGRGVVGMLKFDARLTGPARSFNRHKTIGVYASLVLLALVLTALPLAFDWAQHGLYALTGSDLPEKPPKSIVANSPITALSMESFWQQVQLLSPQPAEAVLRFPGKRPDAPLSGYLIARDHPHENARGDFYFDAFTGKVLRYIPYEASSRGHQLYYWTNSFHTGSVGGIPGKAILLAGALSVPLLAYFGISGYLRRRFRPPAVGSADTLSVRVNRIAIEAIDIKSFELVSMNGALPRFTPGAHISLRIENGLVRQYSLCNGPDENDRYRIAVKHTIDSRGGSRNLHDRVAVGDILSISAPRNHFPLQTRAAHHVMLAGGIGVTPLMAMARELRDSGASFEMHYFAHSIAHAAFYDVLSGDQFRGKVSFHFDVAPADTPAYLRARLPNYRDGAHLYLCGPRQFMAAIDAVAAVSWPPDAVHVEHFGADPMASAGSRNAFEITLARSGGTFTVATDKTIADVLADNGVASMTTCEQGVCGSCVTRLLAGEADHRDAYLTERERKTGDKIMVCVSRARHGGLVLDV